MFKKIVSSLPFSPALFDQIGFYSKRLRGEETTRRLGLVFVVLAIIAQSLTVFQPSESANAIDNTKSTNCQYFPAISANDINCIPCPNNINIWIDNPSCNPNIIKSKTAINISQDSVNASSVIARMNDQISYTISIENIGTSSISSIKLYDTLSDVIEYASVYDNGGGVFESKTKTISWPDITLIPNAKQTRTFIIKIEDVIPATAQGLNTISSYDCLLTNNFGNSINIKVDCPIQKIIERTANELPVTGPKENVIFASVVLAISTYFYARSRQQEKEIRLIRKDISAGTI